MRSVFGELFLGWFYDYFLYQNPRTVSRRGTRLIARATDMRVWFETNPSVQYSRFFLAVWVVNGFLCWVDLAVERASLRYTASIVTVYIIAMRIGIRVIVGVSENSG